MKALRSFGGELAGLFVEARGFALAIGAWLIVIVATRHSAHAYGVARGIALFAGLALILVVDVVRAARVRRN